ncbi:DUF6777 domain-containing protein, partial [Streptomyces sp. NPDC048331]|uniref:DUF6777 domain-containing protein n=1 Tax=Streptomyces sp. NPDC048331 TaxID=3365534 RepID=UPI0037209527
MVSAVVLSFTVLGGNTAAGGEVFLQAAPEAGPDPFTPSTATQAESVANAMPMNPGANTKDATNAKGTTGTTGGTDGTRTLEVDGGYPGLYGGTRNVAACDVEKQIRFLTQHPDKGRAFAASLNVRQPEVPSYLRSLTPVRLGWDTRVTNHGYRDGAPTSYQAVLQAGTSVLVDAQGVPRVRCACGNPLDPPVAVRGRQTYSGAKWSSFRSSGLVAVKPAAEPVKTVTVFDQEGRGWYERPSGAAQGRHDRAVPPPKGQPAGSAYPVLPAAHQGSGRPPSGTPPNRTPGDAPERAPGKEPASPSDRKPDKDPDEGPKTAPGRDPDTDPGKTPEKAPDKESGENREKEPGRKPDRKPGPDTVEQRDQNRDKTPGEAPAEDPGKEPGKQRDKEPGQDAGKERDQNRDKTPGEAPAEDPGKQRDKEPGKEPGKQRDKEPGKEPGKQRDKEPGQDAGKERDQNRDKTPGEAPAED